jgi:hypothetical protein
MGLIMPKDDRNHEARIRSLEQQIETLKNVLGNFAVGLDKVSQAQADQTDVIEGLLEANETQAHYLKRLVENSEENNGLLRRLLEKKDD